MRILLLLGLTMFCQLTLAHGFHSGFLPIRGNQELYVEYKKASRGKTTFFLANGLTYSTRQWKSYVDQLLAKDPDVGIVLYDMVGQGETLLHKLPVNYDIPIENQVRDLHDLKLALKIEGPTSLVGLSYGGGVALYYATLFPDDFDNIIVMAPFIERLAKQDRLIEQLIASHRFWYPFDVRSDEALYDLYLRHLVYTTYPTTEPIILENPFKAEGVFRMVKGAKHWLAIAKADLLPKRKIHILAAERDEHVELPRLNLVAEAYKDRSLASYVVIEGSTHKIPETEPAFAAAWTLLIAANHPLLKSGLTFRGTPLNGEARSGEHVIPVLSKALSCEDQLQNLSEAR